MRRHLTLLTLASLCCLFNSFAQRSNEGFIYSRFDGRMYFHFPGDRFETAVITSTTGPGSDLLNVEGAFIMHQRSAFHLELRDQALNGFAYFHDDGIAYRISREGLNTDFVFTRVPLDEILCTEYRKPPVSEKQIPSNLKTPELMAVPLLESLPGATAVLYLDFDGETVTGTSWNSTYNSGNPIVAAPSGLSNANVTNVWQRVAEDYLPFNINVTTDSTKYNAAPQGRRMKCIITPTDAWYPSSVGGVAYIWSFQWTGKTPCWVFITSNNKYIAEACSHELGHTVGLYHDGQNPSTTYYLGHGTGNVGWAPIMGAGYYEYVSQWCIGEYSGANNQEDDVAKISGTSNGFGYRPDDHSDTATGATPLLIVGNSVSATSNYGVIETRSDKDVHAFTITSTFNMNLSLQPGLPGPNLDILAELRDQNNNVVLSSNVATDLYATLVQNNLAPGTYYIYVDGVGYGTPSTGYTDYASIGHFDISGTLTIVPGAVTITPLSSTTFCGSGSATLQASSGFTSYTWAPAASLSASTGQTVTASPTVTTTYTVTAVPPSGPATQAIITVVINPLPLITVSPSSPSFCAGDSVQVNAGGASTYSWSPSTGLSNPALANPWANPSAVTTYTVTGTDANGCSNTSTVTVTPNPVPTLTLSNSQPVFCDGDSSLLTVSTNGTTYSWSPASGLSCISCTSPVASPSSNTLYTVLVTDANGCTATDTTGIAVNPLPNVLFSGLGTVCADWLPFVLTGGTPGGGTYSGPGVSGGNFDPSAAGAGTHTITYSYTDGNGCSSSDTTIIVVSPCTGIQELITGGSLVIFPVPVKNDLNILPGPGWSHGEYELILFNSIGEKIYSVRVVLDRDALRLRLPEGLAPGVYSVLLAGPEFTGAGRFMKE